MTVSYQWLLAEAIAWPLTSEESFDAGLIAFERERLGVFAKTTDGVAIALEDRLRPQSRGLSLEAIRQLTIRAWFGQDGGESTQKPAALLARIAAEHLCHDGSNVRLRHDGDAAATAQKWRWLSLVLPCDTLVAALSSSERKAPLRNVDLSPHLLNARLNEAPVAEGHLHVGAAVSFDMLWSSLSSVIGGSTFASNQLQKSGRPPFGSNQALTKRLLEAFLVRTLLASFLATRNAGFPADLATWWPAGIAAIANRLDWAQGPYDAGLQLTRAADALKRAAPSEEIPILRALYRKLTGLTTRRVTGEFDPFDMDPLARSYRSGSPDLWFQYEAFDYIGCNGRGPGDADTAFQQLFWQYLRVRNIIFRHVVEQPGTSGLDWFGRHYYRISPLRAGLESTLFRRAIDVQSRGLSLGAIEVRTSPPTATSELLRMLREIAAQSREFGDVAEKRGHTRPEIGLVLHFIKGPSYKNAARTTLHADPRTLLYGCRYGKWFHDALQQADSIKRVFRYYPEMLVLLRGVDVANTELSIPTWAVLPLLREVRSDSTRAALQIRDWPAPWNAAPIRTTIHAGEEYRTLLEGIRRVHELVEFDGISNGDRIGHGIALGEVPARWRQRAGSRITQPREERLDDLLWLLDRFAYRDIIDQRGLGVVFEREALEHGREIYRRPIRIDMLLEARRLRHDPALRARTGYPFMASRAVAHHHKRGASGLLYRYLRDPDVFVRGHQPVAVTITDEDIATLEEVQDAVRRKLAKMQVTVESNPSSNLLIGELTELDHHPAFRMQPITDENRDSRLLLSINTDNPLTFATSLADEYAYIYYALLQHRGVTSSAALAWLEQRRNDGWLARFTLRASAQKDVLDKLATRRP